MDTTQPDWSTLPELLLNAIAKRLPTRIDALSFRAVCNSFRLSVPPPPQPLSPLSDLKISCPHTITPYHYGDLTLAQSTICAFESLDSTQHTGETWLVKVEELSSGKVRVGDPVFKLCSKTFSQLLPKSLNLLDFRVKEIIKVYRLQLQSEKFDPSCFRKVVVSNEDELELEVMALFIGGEVGLWRSENKTWTNIEIGGNGFKDAVYHNKKFFATSSDGRTITVDPKSLNCTEVAAPVTKSNDGLISLVKSLDDLFLIDKYWLEKYNRFGLGFDEFGTVRMDIFKLDEERREWIKVQNGILENQAVFLGEDYSFFVSPEDFSGVKKNCIYLYDKDFSRLDSDYPALCVVNFYKEDDDAGWRYEISSYSNIFWPPPTWLEVN